MKLQLTKRFIKRSLLALIALVITTSLALWWFWEAPLQSPLTNNPMFLFLQGQETPASSGKVIYGFLPYWNMNKTTIHPELTHLAYFSLTIAGDGSVITREGQATEPGYHRMSSEAFLEIANQTKAQGGQVELVLTQFNNDDIVSLVSSPAAQDRLLAAVDAALLAYPFSGINIDIEYTGPMTPQLKRNMTGLVQKMNQHLDQKYDHITLSIDMYASAASKEQLWDVQAIGQEVDYIIVMAYDFHRRSSPQAGPVAPLFGGKEYWDSDISEHLQAFLQVVPSEKILLGIPFYGYEWQTTSADPQATTFPNSGSTASFERVQTILNDRQILGVTEAWNEAALSPYLSYQKNGETYVIYYENSRSLSYKLDYVNQLDLGGIAIWALGYEGSSRELWDVVQRKL